MEGTAGMKAILGSLLLGTPLVTAALAAPDPVRVVSLLEPGGAAPAATGATAHAGDDRAKRAHAAYLAGDMAGTMLAARDAIEGTGSPDVRANMLQLVDSAIEQAGDTVLPLDWKKPAGVRSIVAGTETEKGAGGKELRRVKLIVGLEGVTQMKQMRLIRHPGRVLIDVAKGIGFSGEWGTDSIGRYHWTGRILEEEEPVEGLYRFAIEIAPGGRHEGWFILTRPASSATPVLHAPTPDQELVTATPELRFGSFRSPQYRPLDHRDLLLSVNRNAERSVGARQELEPVWTLNVDEPAFESVVVGPGPGVEAGSAERLSPGAYFLRLTWRERHHFGPVLVSRDSTTTVPFRVRE